MGRKAFAPEQIINRLLEAEVHLSQGDSGACSTELFIRLIKRSWKYKTRSGDNPGKAVGIVGSRRPARLSVQSVITKLELSVRLIKNRGCSDGNCGLPGRIMGRFL